MTNKTAIQKMVERWVADIKEAEYLNHTDMIWLEKKLIELSAEEQVQPKTEAGLVEEFCNREMVKFIHPHNKQTFTAQEVMQIYEHIIELLSHAPPVKEQESNHGK